LLNGFAAKVFSDGFSVQTGRFSLKINTAAGLKFNFSFGPAIFIFLGFAIAGVIAGLILHMRQKKPKLYRA